MKNAKGIDSRFQNDKWGSDELGIDTVYIFVREIEQFVPTTSIRSIWTGRLSSRGKYIPREPAPDRGLASECEPTYFWYNNLLTNQIASRSNFNTGECFLLLLAYTRAARARRTFDDLAHSPLDPWQLPTFLHVGPTKRRRSIRWKKALGFDLLYQA